MADAKLVNAKLLQNILDGIAKAKNKKIKFELAPDFEESLVGFIEGKAELVYKNIGFENAGGKPTPKTLTFSEFMNP